MCKNLNWHIATLFIFPQNSDADSTDASVDAGKASGKKPLKVQNLINNIKMDSEKWKCKRGKQNDANQFTTENKLSKVKNMGQFLFIFDCFLLYKKLYVECIYIFFCFFNSDISILFPRLF